MQTLDDDFAFGGEWKSHADFAVGDMTLDMAGGYTDFLQEFEEEYAGAGGVWKLSPDESFLVEAHLQAEKEEILDSLYHLDIPLASFSESNTDCQTPREEKKANSAPTTTGTDACYEKNLVVPETCTIFSSLLPLAGPPAVNSGTARSISVNYSGSSSEDPLSALKVQQNPFTRKTLAGGTTETDSTPFHLDDGTPSTYCESLILFDGIVDGTEEEAGYYSKFAEGSDSRSMDISESRDNVSGTLSVDSHVRFEANSSPENLDCIMYSADGSTPSEHTTTSPALAPTVSSESDHQMDFTPSKLLPFEQTELSESEFEACLLQLLEMEPSLPSDSSSVELTRFSSGTSEMEIDEEDSEMEIPEEEVVTERSLLLVDAMTWAEIKHQVLHGNSSTTKTDPNYVFLHRPFVSVTPVIPEVSPKSLAGTISVSCDVKVTKNCNKVIPFPGLSSSPNFGGNKGEECIQRREKLQPIDWTYEKDCIISKMLGKQTARTAPSPLHEELGQIVQRYHGQRVKSRTAFPADLENYGKNGVQTAKHSDGRTLTSFQRSITLITNSYCLRHSRKVRYLPDFCKAALREWVQIDAHQKNPYPEKEEILRLADESGLTCTQVEQWFENYRVRSWNPHQNGMRKGKFFRYPTERTAMLKQWILDHKNDPNPKGKDLETLIEKTGMTSSQVKQWCYNFRRRHKSEML